MRKPKPQKPCPRCGGPKPRGYRKTCDNCKPVDACWRQLIEEPEKGCWLWTGKTLQGYGVYSNWLVHRLVYEALIVEIPRGPGPRPPMSRDPVRESLASRAGHTQREQPS